MSLPRHDDEEVQSVPGVPKVTATAEDPQGDHLYNHLQSEEDVDERVKGLTERRRRDRGNMSENKRGDGVISHSC